jgi:hypothetical protein
MNNIALLISVGLIGVAIGFALGMVVASFRGAYRSAESGTGRAPCRTCPG